MKAYRAALEELTQESVPFAWAETENNLGNALQALGKRETGTALLKEAIVAYQGALRERKRERVPLQWAATQNDLGSALETLGEREGRRDRLEEAVEAYRAALEVVTTDVAPYLREFIQTNLERCLLLLRTSRRGAGASRRLMASREQL